MAIYASMWTIQRIRLFFVVFRKWASCAKRLPFFKVLMRTIIRPILACWQSLQNCATKNSQTMPVVHCTDSNIGDRSTISSASGISTVVAPFQPTPNSHADIVNLQDVAFSLYPHSDGSHRNSWPSLPRNASNMVDNVAFLRDLSILDNSTISAFRPSSTVYTARNSLHVQLDMEEHATDITSRSTYLRHPRIKPKMPEATSRYDVENRKL